jgi:IS66 C-terminal element
MKSVYCITKDVGLPIRHLIDRTAVMYTIIETAKLNGLDPEAYLHTLITRIASHPAKRIDELLPWNIKI